ncbi:MAG: hypothetical protein ACFFCE_16060 [Promethearchaeota archaeon]
MKESDDKEIPQNENDILLIQEDKKNPLSQFFIDMRDDIEEFSEKSGEYFLEVKKNVESDWGKFKNSWKNMIKKFRNLDPKHKRLAKLYNKVKEMDSKISEIREDTKKIRLDISDVATLIEQLMEKNENIEDYMKENLGSDWKVLKNSWQKCKEGEISKWEFAKIGLSKVGKRFAGIFIKV